MASMTSPKKETFTMHPVKVQPSKEQLTPYKFVLLVLVREQFHKHRAERCMAHMDMEDEYYPWVPFTQKQKRKAMTTLLQLLQSPDLSISELKACLDPLKTAFFSTFYERLATFETEDKGLMGVECFLDGLATILSDGDHSNPAVILIDRCSVVGLFLRRMLLAYKQMSFSQLCSFQARLRSYLTGKPITTYSDFVTASAVAATATTSKGPSSSSLSLSLSPTHPHPPDAFADFPAAAAAAAGAGFPSSGGAFSAIGTSRPGGDSSINGGDSSIPGVFPGGASGGLPQGSGAPPLGNSNKDLLPQDLFSFETPTRPGANEPTKKSCVEEKVTFSHKQAEFFISQQTSLLALDSNKALSPKELQKKLLSMLEQHPDIAEAHFLSYLNNLRVREYCTAVYNLYHYFDRTTQLCGADSTSSASGSGSSNAKRMEDEVSRRYAALNLAALHFNFGHQREAKAALLEAIRMAQENNDHVCLQHALSWLNLLDDHSDRISGHINKSTANKVMDTSRLHYLTSLGVQSLARHNALAAASPSSVFDYMMRSSIINCQNSLYGMMSISAAHRAGLWTYYGNRECAAMCSQLVLTQDLEDKGVFYSGETIAISLCLLARHHADRGDHQASKEILGHAKQRFPPLTQHAHLWQACEQAISFQRALLQGNWSEAHRAANSLRALDDCEGRLHLARLLRERGETTASLEMLDSLREEWEHRKDLTPDFLCRVLLEQSEVLMTTDNHTTALPQLTKCLSHATHHHLHYHKAITTMYLAVVQMRMKLSGQALRLLESCMLGILSHGAPYDCARLLFTYAKCKVAAVQNASPEERKTAILGAVSLMTTVVTKFQAVQASSRVKDALYHQARLYHMLGFSAERNRCALRFKQLDQQTPTLSKMAVHAV